MAPGLVAAFLVVAWAVLDHLLPRGLPVGIALYGMVFGSLYALGAIGIVLVYRANRVVNFAQAELGAIAAVLSIELVIQFRVNYFLAVATGFLAAAILGAIIDLTVISVFRNAPRLILAVATIGMATILNGFSIQIPLWFSGGATGLHSEPFETPFRASFSIYPVVFNANYVVAMVAVPAVLVALVWFMQYTDYGVGIRAAAENGDRANLLGVPVGRLSTIVWSIAGFLSAVAVILRVPLVGFVSFTSVSGGGPSLLLRTLAAAVIGRMDNLTITAVAAVGLGVIQELAAWTFSNSTYVDAILVVVILVALVAERGKFSRATETGISTWRALREVRPIPAELRRLPEVEWGIRLLGGALLLAVLVLPAIMSAAQQQLLALVFIYAIVALSLVVLTGWAGQISLGQWALVGFGGAACGVLMNRHGWDVFAAIPAGMLVAAAVALIIGLPALRVTGPFLAVTTLAFATTSSTFFLEDRYFPWFVETTLRRPMLWERFSLRLDWQMYYFCLGGLLLTLIAVRNLRRTRTGRALLAVRDNEPAAQSAGIYPTRLKLLAFGLSGAIAGLAGGLYVLHQNGLKTDAFGPLVSVRLFSMVVIGGLGSIPGAILGALYVRGSEYFLPGGWSQIASGFGLLLLLLLMPGGLGEALYRIRDMILRRIAARRGLVVPSLMADVRVPEPAPEPEPVGVTG